MQINLLNIDFKKALGYLGWILLFCSIWFRGCSSQKETVKKVIVKTPEVKSVFETKTPDQKPLEWPKNDQEKPVLKWKDREIKVENPINIELANKYVMAKDSIERLNLYIKSIQLNRFSTKFEDDNLLLNINGIVQGEIQEITPSYTIKSKEFPFEIKQKETVFRLLAGGGLGINKDFNQVIYKIDVDFQNKKGDILSAEYIRINSQDYGVAGFKKSLFTIKR